MTTTHTPTTTRRVGPAMLRRGDYLPDYGLTVDRVEGFSVSAAVHTTRGPVLSVAASDRLTVVR